MKKSLLFIYSILFINICFAQTETTIDSTAQNNNTISFIAYWSKGDSYNFKITKIKQKYKKEKLIKETKNEYITSFTVIDSTANSYTISWKYENDLGNTFKLPKKLINKFSKYKFTEIKYKTSEVGEFKEIINWEEVSEIMLQMIDDIALVLAKDNDKLKKTLNNTLGAFKKIYSSKQGIEQIVLKELQYFHFPLGYEFETNKALEYEDELPNMFGGKPIKAKGKLQFESIDKKEGFCILKQNLDVNQEDTKKLLKIVFKKLGLNNKKIEKALKTASIKITDRNIYEYYYDPGVPHKIETIRETLINMINEKGRNIEKTIIELQYNKE